MPGGDGIDASLIGIGLLAPVEHVVAFAVRQRLTELLIAADRGAVQAVLELARAFAAAGIIRAERDGEIGDTDLGHGPSPLYTNSEESLGPKSGCWIIIALNSRF